MDRAILEASERCAVFLPNFNHGRFLTYALDALLAQSVPAHAIHVVDDGSTDDSPRIIADYAARHPRILARLHAENRGVVRRMSEWLAQAEAEFVLFAAADDVVMPQLIERSLALLLAHPRAGLCSALTRLLDEDSSDLGPYDTPIPLRASGYIPPEQAAQILMRDDSWFLGNTTIYRRAALEPFGGFDPRLAGFSDGFVSRAIALAFGACFIPCHLAYWRRMQAGFATQTLANAETARQVADHAVALMEGPHRDVFPGGYAHRWRRRWIFGAAVACSREQGRKGRTRSLNALFGPDNAVKRLLLALLARVPSAVVSPLLLVVMRPWDVWSVLRRRVFRIGSLKARRSSPQQANMRATRDSTRAGG